MTSVRVAAGEREGIEASRSGWRLVLHFSSPEAFSVPITLIGSGNNEILPGIVPSRSRS